MIQYLYDSIFYISKKLNNLLYSIYLLIKLYNTKMNPKYCMVFQCRYANSHTTDAHLCGNCQEFGHGLMECSSFAKRNYLQQYITQTMPPHLQCTFTDCKKPWSHNNRAHHCDVCKDNHSTNECPQNIKYLEICCPTCRTSNKIPSNQKKITGLSEICKVCMSAECEVFFPQCSHVCVCIDCANQINTNQSVRLHGGTQLAPIDMRAMLTDADIVLPSSDSHFIDLLDTANKKLGTEPNKIYTILYAGMGCSMYVRRDNYDSDAVGLKGFFMHTDAWGQYGVASDDTRKVEMFIDGYRLIE